jgi:hypothetical protein
MYVACLYPTFDNVINDPDQDDTHLETIIFDKPQKPEQLLTLSVKHTHQI